MTFVPRIVWGDIDLTDSPYMIEFGFDLSSPTTVYEAWDSLIVDGSMVSAPRAGNRETLELSVLVEWADSVEAATYAKALELEAGKPTSTLTFYPGDGYGAATVLTTFAAQFVHDWDQDLEQAGLRRYVLTMPALPYGRSVDPVTLNWTGPGVELDPLTSLTGWTVVSGAATISSGIQTTSTVTLEKSVALDEYLWLVMAGDLIANDGENELLDVMVNGVEIPFTNMRKERQLGGTQQFYTIPTSAWRGETATVRFTLTLVTGTAVRLAQFWSRSYPSPRAADTDTQPRGIGVIDVIGSARAPATITFTAPAGGAFVYTAPDPNAAIRERGASEAIFASFTVTDPLGAEVGVGSQLMWFPQGTHATNIGVTAPQPAQLHPNGIWPTQSSGVILAPSGSQWAYPVDTHAATAFFSTSGAKTIISPSAALPEGYHSGADHFEVPSLHPGRCGFAVLDVNGDPVTATITYHPHWWHHAGQ